MGANRAKGSRAVVAALLAAAFVAGCGGEETERPEQEALTACEALDAEPTGDPVRIDGTAHRVQALNTGFVLVGGGCAIFAAAPMGATPVEREAEIWLDGQLARLDQAAAERLKFAHGRIADRNPFHGASIAAGDPYVDVFSVQSQPSQPEDDEDEDQSGPTP